MIPCEGSNLADDLPSNAQKMNTMKPLLFSIAVLGAGSLLAQTPTAADSTGLPGDNFSLQAALDLFKSSPNMESFEKALNDPEKKINNLDLNGDGNVDYIRVVDNKDGDAHAIVLQVPVNGKEAQDVAVIELEKTGENTAKAQIQGDAILYGDSVLFEPVGENVKGPKGVSGPDFGDYAPVFVVVNVWGWPCVRYVYEPAYVVWVSPWYWDYYPGWYRPWHPYSWHAYYGYNYHYHSWCRPVYHNDFHSASVVYAHRRSTSTMVAERTRPAREAHMARMTEQHRTRATPPNSGGERNMARPANGQRTQQTPGVQQKNGAGGRPMTPANKAGQGKQARPAAKPTNPQARPQRAPQQRAPRPARAPKAPKQGGGGRHR